MSEFGYVEGEICKRSGCAGVVKQHERGSCSCHINPPCGSCTEPRGFCEECGWEESEDYHLNGYIVSEDKATGVFRSWEPRPLDPSKIDWRNKSHTHFSMIKEGVYPEGTTMEDVREKVKGTFGGTFKYFGSGRFKYVAYTD